MKRDILSPVGSALAGIVLALAAGHAAADHGSEHSNHIAPRSAAVPAPQSAGLSKQEFIAQAERAWDRQSQDAEAKDGHLSAEQVQAVRRALSQPESR